MKDLNVSLICAIILTLVTLFYLVILRDTNKAIMSAVLTSNMIILSKLSRFEENEMATKPKRGGTDD